MGYRLNKPEELARALRESGLYDRDKTLVLEELGILERSGKSSSESWGARQQRLDRAVKEIGGSSGKWCDHIIQHIR